MWSRSLTRATTVGSWQGGNSRTSVEFLSAPGGTRFACSGGPEHLVYLHVAAGYYAQNTFCAHQFTTVRDRWKRGTFSVGPSWNASVVKMS